MEMGSLLRRAVGFVALAGSALGPSGSTATPSVAEARIASAPSRTMNCGLCSGSAFNPFSPYNEHRFSGGAEADNDVAAGQQGGPQATLDGAEGLSASERLDEPGSYYDCVIWNSCHSDWQTGSCAAWHSPCTGGDFALAKFEDARRSRSWLAMAAVVVTQHKYLRLGAGGRTLQVLGCDGKVIAQEPLASVV